MRCVALWRGLHPSRGSLKDHECNGCQLCKSSRYCEPHDYEYCCPCKWHQTKHDRQLNGVENNIKKKACSCEGFPFHEVIQEFLLNKDKLDLPGINLQNESRNAKVIKGDQLHQENSKVNTSVLYSVNSSKIVKTSNVRAGPPNTFLGHSGKVNMHTIQKLVKKNSTCLDRHSSDEESGPVFGKVKNTTRKMKHSSQKNDLAQFKESDHNKQRNPPIHAKETKSSVKSYKTTGNEEKHFSDPAKTSLGFLQCHKKDDGLGTCLDSPLPLSQRLKLRFQNT
ncbi:Flap endonuclease GEN-like protein 1 [Heterocephalus glaber]|uniref:Flap endonuclease GEN-like protein 1 n=1 Tax=Heterocephalus glaber TaxID=10181 RepID=G5AZT6_HETGA|nr:Flap endonuclease GEN-like protein 1 [Heterocephalus glaber]